MKFYAALLAALGLCACHPNDTHIKTVKERLDEGEIVEMTGKMHGGCKDKEWTDVRTIPEEQRRIVIGKQESLVGPGIYQCYKTGGALPLKVNGKADPANGVVYIERMFWARGDKIGKSKLKGRFFASTDEFNKYMNNVKSRPNYDGYVHILQFSYVNGTSVDEKRFIEEERVNNLGDGFEETKSDGENLPTCRNEWTDIRIGETSFTEPVMTGRIGSWFQLGKQNCLKQGAVVEVRNGFGNAAPVVGKVKIKKVKRFRFAFLDRKYFTLNNFEYADLEAVIRRMNATRNDEWMTVTDLEVVP